MKKKIVMNLRVMKYWIKLNPPLPTVGEYGQW